MTYLPNPPVSSTPNAGPLSDADLLLLGQAGVTRRATLATLKAFVAAGATGSTGSTGGSTGTTGGSTGATANPPVTNSSPVVRNTSTTPVAVSRVAVRTQPQPAFSGTTGSGESANGSEINSTSGSLKANNGDVFTLRDGGNGSDGQPRGLCLFVNGGDVQLKEGNSSHGLRFAEKLRWRTAQASGGPGGRATGPQLAIYSEGDWFIAYGPPWTNCYLLGDDPNVQDGYVIPNAPPTGSQPFPLGARVANTDSSVYADWAAQAAAFLGPVQYINLFNVFGQGWSTWANAAGAIASNAKNNAVSGSMIPVVGIKLSDGKFYGDNNLGDPSGHDCNKEYRDIINGVHDTDITNVAVKWFEQYNLVYLRIAYEFNGEFMPDYFGKWQNGGPDTTTLNLWIAAFKKMADLWRAAASTAGKTVKIVWNPNANQYADNGVKNAYPGDSYVDVIGIDMYAPCYEDSNAQAAPGSAALYNGDGTYSNSIKEWLAIDANQVRWWDQGTGDYYYQSKLENQFGFQTALDFIKLKGKPMMMCETGSGNREQWRNTGPCDDPLFPVYLRSRLDQAVNMGIPVIAVMLWVSNESDGGWGCINGERRKQAQAWSAAFGGSQAATLITAGSGQVNPTTGSTGSTGGSTGGTTGSTGSTGGASSGNAPSPTSSMVLTPIDGTSVTLSLAAEHNWYQNETGLSFNVYFFLDSTNNTYTVGSSRDDLVASIAFTDANNVVCSYPHTYNGAASGGATGGTGIATVHVVDTSGNVADLTLNQGYKNYYGSGNDTSLTCNIYYFADTNNAPTISSSAPGVVASMLITRNGTTVTASADLAGVVTYA